MNDIISLRAHLFETLSALQDKENPMDIDRARAVGEVAQVIINSAKVEVDYARVTGKSGSCFLGVTPKKEGVTPTGKISVVGNITTHKLRG